jgi:predicted ABC-type ATPase
LLLTRIQELRKARADFGFETTLAGRNYLHLLEEMKQDGYCVSLFFLWLPNPDMAVSRVALRVSEGGHYLPEEVIRRRYDLGLKNLFDLYRPLVDTFEVYNASVFPPLLAAREKGGDLEILDQSSYRLFTECQKR